MALVGCSLALVVTVGLRLTNGLESSSQQLTDVAVRARAWSKASGRIVVVAIDSAAIDRTTPWPWSRARIARLVSAVNQSSPAAIGLNLDLSTTSNSAQGDEALRRTAQASTTIIEVNRLVDRFSVPFLGSRTSRQQSGITFAWSGLNLDSDGVLRGADATARTLPTFSAALARAVRPGSAISDSPLAPQAQIPTYSAAEVLDGLVPAAALRGKSVVIGPTAAGIPEFVKTPRGTEPITEAVAQLADAFARGDAMSKTVAAVDLAAAAVVAILIGLAALLLPPHWAWATGVGVLVAACVGAYAAFVSGHIVGVAYILSAGLTTGLVITLARVSDRARAAYGDS